MNQQAQRSILLGGIIERKARAIFDSIMHCDQESITEEAHQCNPNHRARRESRQTR